MASIYAVLKERFPGLTSFARKILTGEAGKVQRSIQGENNLFQAEGCTLNGVRLDIIGSNNRIELERGGYFSNVTFRLRGSNHRIHFEENCRISRGAVLWFEDEGGLLEVGRGTTMVEVHIAVTEGARVTIGEDCMFANDIDIRTGDSHSVIDSESGTRLNPAADVTIGRHVWIAPHTVVLKGVNIAENTIVATGAVVTKSCGPNVIAGGNPARAIKSGVTWRRERLPVEPELPEVQPAQEAGPKEA